MPDPETLPEPDTIRKLVRNAPKTRDKTLMMLLWSTGGRISEIFLIPLNSGKQFRENLESAIADEIRNSSNTGDLPLSGSPKQDYEPDEESETIEINTNGNFICLPKKLEI